MGVLRDKSKEDVTLDAKSNCTNGKMNHTENYQIASNKTLAFPLLTTTTHTHTHMNASRTHTRACTYTHTCACAHTHTHMNASHSMITPVLLLHPLTQIRKVYTKKWHPLLFSDSY